MRARQLTNLQFSSAFSCLKLVYSISHFTFLPLLLPQALRIKRFFGTVAITGIQKLKGYSAQKANQV